MGQILVFWWRDECLKENKVTFISDRLMPGDGQIEVTNLVFLPITERNSGHVRLFYKVRSTYRSKKLATSHMGSQGILTANTSCSLNLNKNLKKAPMSNGIYLMAHSMNVRHYSRSHVCHHYTMVFVHPT